MGLSLELIQRYPWLPSTKLYYSEVGDKDVVEFISDVFKKYDSGELQVRITEFFKAAFQNLESFEYYIDELNVYMYFILKILIYVLNEPRISNRIGNLYSKMAYQSLKEEGDYNIYYLVEDLGLNLQYNNIPWHYRTNTVKNQKEVFKTNFRIHYVDYLKLASGLRDDHRKLTNNSLKDGYVFIQKQNLGRLLQEHVRKKILDSKAENVNVAEALKQKLFEIIDFELLCETLMNEWELKKEEFEYTSEITYKDGQDLTSFFPPCLKDILTRAQEGQNLNHTERLFLVFMLHALEYPEEKVVNVFSTMPDFDYDKTAYQVRFAKQKGYTPHSCGTLQSLGLCLAKKYKDKLCLEGYHSKKLDMDKKIKHPLFYIQYHQFVSQLRNNSSDDDDNNKKESIQNE